jgi:hypothetical protein
LHFFFQLNIPRKLEKYLQPQYSTSTPKSSRSVASLQSKSSSNKIDYLTIEKEKREESSRLKEIDDKLCQMIIHTETQIHISENEIQRLLASIEQKTQEINELKNEVQIREMNEDQKFPSSSLRPLQFYPTVSESPPVTLRNNLTEKDKSITRESIFSFPDSKRYGSPSLNRESLSSPPNFHRERESLQSPKTPTLPKIGNVKRPSSGV